MKRTLVLLAVLTLLVVPLPLARPKTAGAVASTMTVVTTERGSGAPVANACYNVQDLIRGGAIVAACDKDDGASDGTTTLTSSDPCSSCRVHQSLPDDPVTGLPTDYLREPSQDTGWGGSVTFANFLKPYLAVTAHDARTGAVVPGVCIAVQDLDRGGGAAAGCDGDAHDADGQRNGTITTKRLARAGNYRVNQTSPPPAGYVRGPSVDVVADPAATGEFEAVTIQVPPAPRIVITTVDKRTGARIKGACYAISDRSHGGGLGTLCDGQRNGTFGDQDGVKNGVIRTQPLPVGHTYLLDQTKTARGYRIARPDREVTTVAGENAAATFKNRRAG
jgi:hypothetical protein